MFSLPWSRPKPERFSLENLKILCKQLQSFAPDARREPIITCLKELTQILVWGDQHDPMLLEHFFERGVHWHFLELLQSKDDGALIVQVLQTLNIMFENVRSRESLYFLLSNNYVNQVICLRYDFSNDEVLAYYIYLLRTLSFKLSKDTINFFFNEHLDDFPLYSEAIKFFNHEESMIRIAVRVITLNVYGVGDQQMQDFILDRTTTTYFSNLVWFIGNYGTTINDILLHPSEGEMSRVDYYLAEHIDCFYYINDIVELEVPKINKILISFVLNRLLRPIYIESLLPPGAQGSSNPVRSAFASPKLSPAVVLSLLLHAFHVLKYAPLVSALATTIFANQQHVTAHAGQPHHHPIHSLQQQAAGLSPGSSRSSSPVSTPQIHSPFSLLGSSPSSKHHAKEPALVFPSNTSGQRASSRRSSLTDSSAHANPYKAVIFGYLSQTENDRLVLPTLLLIYLACRNTGAMADVLMSTDIYPQRLLKSRMLMGNLMGSSLFRPGSGASGVENSNGSPAVAMPIARGLSVDALLGVNSLGTGGQHHNSLLQTMSSSFGSSATGSTTTTGFADGRQQRSKSPQLRGGLSPAMAGGNGLGRMARTESPLFENSEEDEESRETEELLAGAVVRDVPSPPLPPSPNIFSDARSSPSSRALSIRSHKSSSSLVSHLPMPQLPSPKVRQTPAFFPSSNTTAQAAVAALSTATATTAAGDSTQQQPQPRQDIGSKSFDYAAKGSTNVSTAVNTAPPASSSSQTSIVTHATMGGASVAADAVSMLADDNTTAPSSPQIGSKGSGTSLSMGSSTPVTTTVTDADAFGKKMDGYQEGKVAAGRVGEKEHTNALSEQPYQPSPPPPLPPRRVPMDDDDDDASTSTTSTFPSLPIVQNREELIQRLLDIVTCAGRKLEQQHASSHRFRTVTIQVAAELLLEFVYVKGGVPAGGQGVQVETKRRASSSAIPNSLVASSFSSSSNAPATGPSSDRGANQPSTPLRLYENMLTEEQMQQIQEAEEYFRERVRRGVELLTQYPDEEMGTATQSTEFQPMGVKTKDVERAIQQTKLGLDKKVAMMLGDSKLLYGPPPEGDPDVDLDPHQVDDILANIELKPLAVSTNVTFATNEKDRIGRRPARHLSMDRQQDSRAPLNNNSGGYSHHGNTNHKSSRRGRSISRNRLTAFMEDIGGGAFSGNYKKPSSAGSSSASLNFTSASGRAGANVASAPLAGAASCTGYGSANARLSPRVRLEKRVLRSIQWLHILVQCRQLLCHSRNVWSAPIFAGATFGSMTSATNVVAGGGGNNGGTASSWSSSASSRLSSTEKAPSLPPGHPLQPEKNRNRQDTTSTTTRTAAKKAERPVEPLQGSTGPSSPTVDHPLSPTLSPWSNPAKGILELDSQMPIDPLMATSAQPRDLKKRRSDSSSLSAISASLAAPVEEMTHAKADTEEEEEEEEEEEGEVVKDGSDSEPRSPPMLVARPSHRLSLHAQGTSAMLKSAAPPALASPAIMLSPPISSPSIFATNGGILGGHGGDGHHGHSVRHSTHMDPLLLSSPAPLNTNTSAKKKKHRNRHPVRPSHHERSTSSSTVESTSTAMTTDTASEPQPQPQPLLPPPQEPSSIFDTQHPWHQKDDRVLGILGSLGFFGATRSTSTTMAPATTSP